MNENRLSDYLDHIRQAATTALPELLRQLPAVHEDADGDDRNDPASGLARTQ